MIAAFAVASALATQAAPSAADIAPERPYAAEFSLGIAALEADDNAAAAAHFTAAGTLAPDAPLWPLYLALARGERPAPPALVRDAGGPWQLLGAAPMHRPEFDSRGAWFMTRAGVYLLWDATSGALVAALSPLGYQQWSFERSGRYVLGARYEYVPNGEVLVELELRMCATGAVAGPALPIGRTVARSVSATWTDTPFEAAPHT